MKVLLLTKYGAKAASSRQRFMQFMPFLESQAISCTVSALLDDDYLEHKFRAGHARASDVARAFWRRLEALRGAKAYDLAVVHCELFPYLPSTFERSLASSGLPYVYDCDDAIFHMYDAHRSAIVRAVYGGKIARVIAGAAHVVAGSRYLAQYARVHNQSVEVIPTVVDTDEYSAAQARADGPFCVGWIGSPSTALYLPAALEPIHEFFAGRRARLRLIGSGALAIRGIEPEIVAWRRESEVEELRALDVGIMPLPDDPWSRGKCGYKLIQYMACGLPVVASPVGANRDIVEHGVDGFLATTPDEWRAALGALQADPALRKAMGEAGRRKVEERYSLRYAAPLVEAAYRRAATSAAARR
jgi:glycosyltransferase involved in cell wall biosynthesis